MADYELTRDAENDLRDVARYTLGTWGKAVLAEYRSGIKQTLKNIGKGKITPRPFSDKFPQLLVTKYRYHFIFYVVERMQKPVIIGVIHERRDVVARLSERLN